MANKDKQYADHNNIIIQIGKLKINDKNILPLRRNTISEIKTMMAIDIRVMTKSKVVVMGITSISISCSVGVPNE